MERAEKREDEGRRESPHDEEEPEEPGDGAEVPSDISTSQQVRADEDPEGKYSESSADISYTLSTTASGITHIRSDQGSGTVPDPPPSSLRLTLAYNSTAAFTDSKEEKTRLRRDDDTVVLDDDNGEDDDDDEDELIILDPEHSLIKRFQSDLKKQLCAQLERLNLEIQEKMMEEQLENTKLEEVGVALYKEQQELAREQAYLEDWHQRRDMAFRDRRQAEEELEEVRKEHSSLTELVKQEHTQVSVLQSEEERVTRRLRYMEKLTSDMRSDVTALKNTKAKAQAERRHAEEQKLQQDLYVERLMKQEEKLKEQIALYEAQTLAQTKEKQAVRDVLAEAQLELDSMMVERKQLLQQWNSSMVEMKRRDEAYSMVQEMLRSANQELRALDTELEGCRRAITQEQEKNEALTVQRKRTELNCNTYKKLLTQTSTQQEELQNLYTTHTRTLQETEKNLNRVTSESNARQSDLTILKKQLEKAASVKVELEEKIMRKMQEQLTHNSTAKRKHHLTTKTMTLQREKEAQLVKVESELAAVELEVSETGQRVQALSYLKLELEQEVMKQNQLLSTKEAAVAKLITTVERKQATMNMYNKKIEQIRASTGHKDLGPLEVKVKTLNTQLEQLEAEIKEQQQLWLRQQGELVRLNQKKQAQSSATLLLKSQLSIMQQKNLRTKREIEQEERGLVELERHFKALRLDMEKLNLLLNQNTQLKQELEQSNILMENSFIHTLKDAERESVEKQMCLEKLQEEQERLLNSLVEAERQIMLWERKIQLARETRLAVDSEVGKEDINTMKAEIHRMENHYSQLMKQREKMLREMEAAVVRRESIVALHESQSRSNRKQTTHTDLQHTLKNLRRSILQAHKQAEEYDGVIALLQLEQFSLTESLRERKMQITDLKNTSSALQDELKNMQETKERNLIQLMALQSRVKQLQAVKEGRYRATARGEDKLQLTTNTLQEHLHSIRDVLQRVVQDVPQHKPLFHRILLLLSVHTPSDLDRT
ncbi:coiled-coil domain-containing protein 40-like isoform X2 [Hemibagrus wyckioides]|nr:coiled-coil domain-containing protein 40-like isoform X2 [Hemibagrus wyckioides]